MMTFFQEVARGLFLLRTGWKTLRDRRLQLPAVLTALVVLNYITIATGISLILALSENDIAIDLIANPILLLLMIISWFYMRFKIVTDEFVDRLLREDSHDLTAKRARKKFLSYLTISIISFIVVLVWVVLVGPI